MDGQASPEVVVGRVWGAMLVAPMGNDHGAHAEIGVKRWPGIAFGICRGIGLYGDESVQLVEDPIGDIVPQPGIAIATKKIVHPVHGGCLGI